MKNIKSKSISNYSSSNKVIITGSSGYIGSKIVKFIIENSNYEIIGIDKIDSNFKHPRFHNIKCDLSTKVGKKRISDLTNLLQDSIVFHLAGLFVKDIALCLRISSEEYEKDNLIATRHLVDAIIDSGYRPKLFVFSSTACVYDGVKVYPTPVEKFFPIVSYGESKLAAEQEVKRIVELIPQVAILRFSRVVGLSENDILPRDIISDFIERIAVADAAGSRCTFNSGVEVRPYIHIDDLMNVVLMLINDYKHKGLLIRNVTSLSPVKIEDIASIVAEVTNSFNILNKEPKIDVLSKVKTKVPVLNPLSYSGFQPNYIVYSDEIVRFTANQYCNMLKKSVLNGKFPDFLSAIEGMRKHTFS